MFSNVEHPLIDLLTIWSSLEKYLFNLHSTFELNFIYLLLLNYMIPHTLWILISFQMQDGANVDLQLFVWENSTIINNNTSINSILCTHNCKHTSPNPAYGLQISPVP